MLFQGVNTEGLGLGRVLPRTRLLLDTPRRPSFLCCGEALSQLWQWTLSGLPRWRRQVYNFGISPGNLGTCMSNFILINVLGLARAEL